MRPIVARAQLPLDVRPVTPDDLELICRHREEMFRDAGCDDQTLSVMTEHFREWLEPRLSDGSYFGFLLSQNDEPAAGIGLMLIDWPPHPSHPAQAQRGYVLNVFVEPDYRRRGLARTLMRLAEEEFAKRGVSFLVLHATEKGQPLYRDLGWGTSSEMTKTIGDRVLIRR
jgi:ribosomal protein S18 acetylase RimI-like enzyme